MSYDVIVGASYARMDGFTVNRGRGVGSDPTDVGDSRNYGGGMHNVHLNDLIITNCIFSNNYAGLDGAGMFNQDIYNVLVSHCKFINNSAYYGGALYNHNQSSLDIVNCSFENNTGRYNTGALANNLSSPNITSCLFKDNVASTTNGGGVMNWNYSFPVIKNCLFIGNRANGNGGGITDGYYSSSLTINCTFRNNWVGDSYGGGSFFSSVHSSPQVVNSILWGGTSYSGPQIYVKSDGSSISVSYSDIQNGWAGTGNINRDPLFLSYPDSHLQAPSSCIDTATPTGAPIDDLDGYPRPYPVGGAFDMGAYEYQYQISINCDSPGPNPVNELSPMQCDITTNGTPQIDSANDTCGGSISASAPWRYNFTPSEAQGPGNCVAAVKLYSLQDNDTITINEVNQNPTWLAQPANLWIYPNSVYNNVNGVASDSDLPNSSSSDPGHLTCSKSNSTCSFQVDVTGSGNGAVGCNISLTAPPTPEICTMDIVVEDGWTPSKSVTKNIAITIAEPPTLSIDCSNPGPNPVDELTAMQCNITTNGTPQKDTANDTCGGTVSGSGPWTYNFTPTEAQGPGNCTAAVRVAEDNRVKSSGLVQINEVNLPPNDNAPASSSWNELTPVSFRINPTDSDIPVQTLTCSLVSNGCPGGSLVGCIWSGWTPTEAQGPTSCNVVTRVYDGVAYSSNKTTHIIVNEVNVAPTWNPAPTNITISPNSDYNQTNGHAVDADLPAQTLSCTKTSQTCSFPIIVSGSGSGAVDCTISFTAGSSNEACQLTVGVSDGWGGTILKIVEIRVGTANVVALSGEGYHTCIAITNGVKCWGRNDDGQLGDNSTTQRTSPVDVVGLSSQITALSTDQFHTCALTSGGGVKCWGYNNYYELGDNTTTNRLTPVDVIGLTSGVSAISVGAFHSCALTSAGEVKCWGRNNYGQLGDNTTTTRSSPVTPVGLSSGVVQLLSRQHQNCVLMTTGGVKCWGRNSWGQLGDGTNTTRKTPVDVSGLTSGVIAIAAGGAHNCALLASGGMKCWGMNSSRQLGDLTTQDRWTPVDVIGLPAGVVEMVGGGSHTCVLTDTGAEKCWGLNGNGQLGDNSNVNRDPYVNVVDLSGGVNMISTGTLHSCALVGNAVKCWGGNSYGQVGDNSTTDRWAPVDVLW